jgi:hypothetical protein
MDPSIRTAKGLALAGLAPLAWAAATLASGAPDPTLALMALAGVGLLAAAWSFAGGPVLARSVGLAASVLLVVVITAFSAGAYAAHPLAALPWLLFVAGVVGVAWCLGAGAPGPGMPLVVAAALGALGSAWWVITDTGLQNLLWHPGNVLGVIGFGLLVQTGYGAAA